MQVQQFGLVNYIFLTNTVLRLSNSGFYTRWWIDIFRVDVVEGTLFSPILCVHSTALRQANTLVKWTQHIHKRTNCKINAVVERHFVLTSLAERF